MSSIIHAASGKQIKRAALDAGISVDSVLVQWARERMERRRAAERAHQNAERQRRIAEIKDIAEKEMAKGGASSLGDDADEKSLKKIGVRMQIEGAPYLRHLLDRTARKYWFTRNDLASKTRSKMLGMARYEFAYLASVLTTASTHVIGQMINKDHTTIVHGIARYKQWQRIAAGIEPAIKMDKYLDLSYIIMPDQVKR